MMKPALVYFRRLGCLIVFVAYASSNFVYAAPIIWGSMGINMRLFWLQTSRGLMPEMLR